MQRAFATLPLLCAICLSRWPACGGLRSVQSMPPGELQGRVPEIFLQLFEPEAWATVTAEGFELRFTLAWDPDIEDVGQLLVSVGEVPARFRRPTESSTENGRMVVKLDEEGEEVDDDQVVIPDAQSESDAGSGGVWRRVGMDLTGGAYTLDLSSMLADFDPRGAEPVSLLLKTPLQQTQSAVAVTLYSSTGNYLGGRATPFYVRNLTLANRTEADACMLSFPGSGNHLARFMVEFLTRRRTQGCSDLRDLPLHLSDYHGPNPLQEVDPAAPPATEKWHWTRSYPPVYHEPRSFASRCPRKLLLLLRDFYEVLPRWYAVFVEANGPQTDAEREARLRLDARVLLDNVLAFTAFEGSKLLLPFDTLTASPDLAAQQLAALFAVAEERVLEWRSRSEELVAACRRAQHGSWQGSRSGGERWTEAELQALHRLFAEELHPYPPAVHQLLRPSLLRFWRWRRQRQQQELHTG